MENNC